MRDLLDAFWRAVAYCLHPRVIALSVAPLAIAGGATWLAGWFYWERAIDGVRSTFESWSLLSAAGHWLDRIGLSGLHALFAPLVVVALAVPVIVLLALLLVAFLMVPALSRMVAARRFPLLERRRGGSWWRGLALSIGWSLLALVALAASIPLWLVPPLVLLVPPLIWGWLTYHVMTYDVLAEHATHDERVRILREQRWPLLGIGLVTGYLGSLPSLLWAVSATLLVLAPILVLVAVWLYTLVFAFSALWFAHYGLAALHRLRTAEASAQGPAAAPPDPVLPRQEPTLSFPLHPPAP